MNYGEALTEDYQRWTVAAAILEAAERFTSQENEPALQEFQLVVGGMKALAENRYEPLLILDAFLLRSLAVAGYAPSMTICSKCEAPGPHRYFSLVGGGSVCADCRPSACATPAPETLELMGALLSSDWDIATAACVPCQWWSGYDNKDSSSRCNSDGWQWPLGTTTWPAPHCRA
jgi:DNA repair protein RecO (recombination protein O)